MPIYEYRCQECGKSFEAIVPNDRTEVTCRHCHSQRLEKQFSTFAVAGPANDTPFQAAPGPCGSCGAARQGMCQMMD